MSQTAVSEGPVSASTYGDDEPHALEIVAPIESVTRDATLAAIRGAGLPAERATLKGLSDAIDRVAADDAGVALRRALINAILFG